MCLPTLTYNEAWELSYFGANVLHPRTTLPAMRYKIPIAIRNFFNLDAPGVCVGRGWVGGGTGERGGGGTGEGRGGMSARPEGGGRVTGIHQSLTTPLAADGAAHGCTPLGRAAVHHTNNPAPDLPPTLSTLTHTHPHKHSLPAGTQVLDLAAERALGGVPTVKGFATIDNVCLINIEGTGMVGVPGERDHTQHGTVYLSTQQHTTACNSAIRITTKTHPPPTHTPLPLHTPFAQVLRLLCSALCVTRV